MPTAAFTTLGCKVNQYETQRILESFEAAGFDVVPFDAVADVYVINSCSVTSIAESKSHYVARKAARTNPNAKVVFTGCAAQMAINKGEGIEHTSLLVAHGDKEQTLERFAERFPNLLPEPSAKSIRPAGERELGRTRAVLKVQDGCDVMCNYCSIPYTRPKMTSRPWADVVDEAKRMISAGYREIVLTGVLIGAYGPQTGSGGPDFEQLVAILGGLSKECRIRISSIEMRQVTDRLIELIQLGKVVPHLHIPLQSGSTKVLQSMNRPYSQDDYLKLCERLYSQIPDLSLTTDIMVGYPTETQEEFECSLEVVRQANFLKAHVFRFSPRFGTPADLLGDPVAPEEKVRRGTELSAAAERSGLAHKSKFVGRIMNVLVEGRQTREGLLSGLTQNYLSVEFVGPKSLKRQFVAVRLTELINGSMAGEIVVDDKTNSGRLALMRK